MTLLGGMGGVAGEIVGPAGCGDRDASGQSWLHRDRESDRAFCEHAGGARGHVGRPTVGEVLERVRKQAITAQQHQDIPFEQVVELVQPVRSLAHSPLFQVTFTWLDRLDDGPPLPGLERGPLQLSPHVVSKFDMALLLQDSGNASREWWNMRRRCSSGVLWSAIWLTSRGCWKGWWLQPRARR